VVRSGRIYIGVYPTCLMVVAVRYLVLEYSLPTQADIGSPVSARSVENSNSRQACVPRRGRNVGRNKSTSKVIISRK
jgi:hypothetical protein